jgi:cytochrome d ubiquinol oxidase subunit I
MIALTLALYVTVYLALIVAYVSVVRYMAEKPVDLPGSTPEGVADAAPAVVNRSPGAAS